MTPPRSAGWWTRPRRKNPHEYRVFGLGRRRRAWSGGTMHEYVVIGLIAIAAVMLAKVVFPKLPVLNGLAGYL
jgi:hypothetical protein